MGIGASIFLVAVGAILAFAVNASISGLDIAVVGWILMVAGVVGLALMIVPASSSHRGTSTRVVRRPRRRQTITALDGRSDIGNRPHSRPCERGRRQGSGASGSVCASAPSTSRTGTPQSCWCTWQAGNSIGRVVVAGRRHRRDVQDAVADVRVEDQAARQLGARPLALAQQLRRGRRHHEPGRRAVAVVELLAGRRREHHHERDLARRELGDRSLRPLRHAVDDQRLVGQPHPGQPVGGRLDDDAGHRRRRPRRSAPRARSPACDTSPAAGS